MMASGHQMTLGQPIIMTAPPSSQQVMGSPPFLLPGWFPSTLYDYKPAQHISAHRLLLPELLGELEESTHSSSNHNSCDDITNQSESRKTSAFSKVSGFSESGGESEIDAVTENEGLLNNDTKVMTTSPGVIIQITDRND